MPSTKAGQNALLIGILIGIRNAGYDLPEASEAIMDERVNVEIDKNNFIKAKIVKGDGSAQSPTNPAEEVFADPDPFPCTDADNDAYYKPGSSPEADKYPDCNDNNPEINPGIIEECGDKVDNDCDGSKDEEGCYWNCAKYDAVPCADACMPSIEHTCCANGGYCKPGWSAAGLYTARRRAACAAEEKAPAKQDGSAAITLVACRSGACAATTATEVTVRQDMNAVTVISAVQ